MTRKPPAKTIMIIDDEPKNLDVLDTMLRQAQYEVSAFPSGPLALAAAPSVAPDLILLDVRMPEMDGYEVCRRFKASASLSHIPIIFLSALTETQDKVLAFEAGAVDYVAKPLSEPEVLARVQTHLALRDYQFSLERLVLQRTQALESALQRLSVLDEAKTHWIHMLSHELRTPLTGIFCIADLLLMKAPQDRELDEVREDYARSCGRIRKLLDDAATLATIDVSSEAFESERVRIADVLHVAVSTAQRRVSDVSFELADACDASLETVACSYLLKRAFMDLLNTAACCTPEGERVAVSVLADDDRAVVTIGTGGEQLPPDELTTFFDIGGQRTLHKGGADFGLGPALAYRTLRLFNADVTVDNGAERGLAIRVGLPLAF